SQIGTRANGASLNQPAAARIVEDAAGRRQSRTANMSIAASSTSVVPVEAAINRGGKASQAIAARRPPSSSPGSRRRRAGTFALYNPAPQASAAITAMPSAPSTESQIVETGATMASGA